MYLMYHFFDQSTLELFIFLFLTVEYTKDSQTMQKQQPTSLLLRGK